MENAGAPQDPKTLVMQAITAIQQQLQRVVQRLDHMEQPQANPQTIVERVTRIKQQREETGFGVAPGAGYVEPKPPYRSLRTMKHKQWPQQQPSVRYDNLVPRIYTFSGNSYPEDYLEWERDMDDWFSYHNYPQEERLECAIKQLTGNAYSWWRQEKYERWKYQEGTITTWENLKWVMIREYVSTHHLKETRAQYPRRYSSRNTKEMRSLTPPENQQDLLQQAYTQPDKKRTPVMEKKNVSQVVVKAQIPENQRNVKQEFVSTPRSDMVQSKISPSVLNTSMTVLMHLSSVKSVETIADAKEKLIEQKGVSRKERELSDQMQNQVGLFPLSGFQQNQKHGSAYCQTRRVTSQKPWKRRMFSAKKNCARQRQNLNKTLFKPSLR